MIWIWHYLAFVFCLSVLVKKQFLVLVFCLQALYSIVAKSVGRVHLGDSIY